MLEALAYALKLDRTAPGHLQALAAPELAFPSVQFERYGVRPGILHLIATLSQPAYVMNRYLDIVAGNSLALTFRPSLHVGDNLVLSGFFDPLEQTLPLDWDTGSCRLVGAFRHSLGNLAGDTRAVELVGELWQRSRRFRELWSSHEVFRATGELARPMKHSWLGEMTVELERLPIGGTDGHILVITSAQPDSESAEKLCRLTSLVERT